MGLSPELDRCRSRFLGYAGFSMILTIPCLFLSVAAARRVLQLHRTIQRSNHSFMKNTGRHHSRSQLSNEQNASSERVQSAVILASETTLAPVGPEMLYSLQPADGRAGVRSTALYHDTDRPPCATFDALPASHERFETWDTLGSIEEDGELDPRRQMGGMMLSCKRHLPSRVVLRLTVAISIDVRCTTSEAQLRSGHLAVNFIPAVSLRVFVCIRNADIRVCGV